MKRTLTTAILGAVALSALMIGGLAAVTPAPWSPRTPGPSNRPLLPVALAAVPSATPVQTPMQFVAPPPPSFRPGPLPTPQAARADAQVVVTPAPRPRTTPRPAPVRKTVSVVRVAATPSVATAKAYALSQIGSTQYACLNQIWTRESNWNPFATNRTSGAYGIPQALPGTKMATAGADWRTNPVTQVKWGLGYIHAAYGSACAAWSFWQAHHWY